jgi:hypothetical protein
MILLFQNVLLGTMRSIIYNWELLLVRLLVCIVCEGSIIHLERLMVLMGTTVGVYLGLRANLELLLHLLLAVWLSN